MVFLSVITAPDTWSKERVAVYALLLSLAGAASVLFVIFGRSLILAPVRQRNELRGQLKQQQTNQARSQILEFLTNLRQDGVLLRNQGPGLTDPKVLETWNLNVGLWRGQVRAAVADISTIEAKLFETLDWFEAPDFGIEDPQHHLQVRFLHVELRNLRLFIDKYLEEPTFQ